MGQYQCDEGWFIDNEVFECNQDAQIVPSPENVKCAAYVCPVSELRNPPNSERKSCDDKKVLMYNETCAVKCLPGFEPNGLFQCQQRTNRTTRWNQYKNVTVDWDLISCLPHECKIQFKAPRNGSLGTCEQKKMD